MERTPLRARSLPDYTQAEELLNMTTHIVGGALALLFGVLCVIRSVVQGDAYATVASSVYAVAMLVLYTMSSIYHGLPATVHGKRVFQVIDHCSVFILIAGTYTPYCLCTLRTVSTPLGWVYFGLVWGITLIAVALNAIDLKIFERFSNICTLVLGWLIITRMTSVWRIIGARGTLLLLAGGIAYTIGAVLYLNGHRHRYMHSVFHIFVLAGTVFQFFSIYMYVI